ncbi:MAG: ankyrin repeat domain-containing protein [Candidatus Micrarchaeota archaeon]|nr:ankyrin repeat domain-containing protein [Candidatus Micrarchaeota archaeon]
MQERKPFQKDIQARKQSKADIIPSEKQTSLIEEQIRLNNSLWHAAKDGDKEEIIRLIKAGADITSKDIIGRNSRFWAVYHEDMNLIRFIESIEKINETMGKESFSSFMKLFSECAKG